ncbi:MAG: serine--tRNA ligase [Candidatus Altiarchaeota archaeon]|nr:serine--tRNA ligase [Candidatus Altiarchaeota archaeon]
MRFILDCTLVFNKPLEGVDVRDILLKSSSVLEKGAPKGEGAKIESSKLEGDRLMLRITSGRHVRPHDAVFRMKNLLAAELGKKHHVGVREVRAEKYKIEFELEKEPKKKIDIAYAKKLEFKEKNCVLELENLDEEFLQRNYVDRMISLIQEKVDKQYYEGKEEHWELIWSSEEKKHAWDKDPSLEMEKRDWIMHRGRGQWIFGPIATKMMKTMEQIVVDELLKPLDVDEVVIPKAVTWDVWKKSGHAKNLYGEIYYLCPPQSRDPELWEEVIDVYKITGEVPTELVKERIKEPIGGMCYAQCPPFWPYLAGKMIAEESLPLKVFDRSGTSMRYESGGIHGIERVDEFHRIEFVWIGYPEQVERLHKEIVEHYKKIFNGILELEWRMAFVTPWFMAQEGMVGIADEEKKIGTIDFEAYMPYKGSREESEWLEFQNASNNGDKYPKGFNVKAQGGELYSGCTGIGLERWLAAFTAQKGLDPENWPKGFRKRLGELPGEIRFL